MAQEIDFGSVGADRLRLRSKHRVAKWRQDLTPQANNLHDQFFGYDKLSQVKSAARGTLNRNRTEIGAIPSEEEGWEYDETGNWLEYQRAEDGNQTIDETRTHNTSNQIKAVDGTNAGIAYDTNGNMTRVPTGKRIRKARPELSSGMLGIGW